MGRVFGVLFIIIGIIVLVVFFSSRVGYRGGTGPGDTSGGQEPPSQPTFQCPSEGQVSGWMNASVSRVNTSTDACAFHAGDTGQPLSSTTCTNQDGGTTIEYTPVSQPNTLVIQGCNGSRLPDIYGFTIRFIAGYPSSGPDSADVCTIARKAPQHLPSGWTVQANC